MFELTTKQSFMFKEVCILAWNASVQRANLYNAEVKPENRKSSEFRSKMLAFIENELLPDYKEEVAEEAHVANIERLVRHGSQVGKVILGAEGYKFGVAQKLLNLLLKYLWCLGYFSEPLHCPVDRIVLDKTTLKGKLNWTAITTKEQYQSAIAAIRAVASREALSLAEWELRVYARRQALTAW